MPTDAPALWTRLATEASTFVDAAEPSRRAAALAWFQEHRTALADLLPAILADDARTALDATEHMLPFLLAVADWATMAEICEVGITAARRLEAVGPTLRLMHTLGVARQHLHDDTAEQIFATVAELADGVGDFGDLRAKALAHLGQLARAAGNPERAAAYQHQAAVAYAAAGNRGGEARALGDLSVTLRDLGDGERAAAQAETSRAIFEEIGDAEGEGRALRYLAAHRAEHGDLDAALTLILKAAMLFDTVSAVALAAEAEYVAAQLHRAAGDLPAARRLAQRCIRRNPGQPGDAGPFLKIVEAELALRRLISAPDDTARADVLERYPILLDDFSTRIILENDVDTAGTRWLLAHPDAAAARWFAEECQEISRYANMSHLSPQLPGLVRELTVCTGEARGELLRQILAVTPPGSPPGVRGKYLLALARYQTDEPQGGGADLGESRALAAEAAELLFEAGAIEDAAASFVLEGTLWRQDRTGDHRANSDRALRALRRALRLFRKTVYPHEWARTMSNLGNVYWQYPEDRRRNLRRAVARHTAALSVLTADRYPEDRSTALANLGLVLSAPELAYRQDNAEAALRYLTEALNGLTSPSTRALVLMNLSNLHRYRAAADYDANAQRALRYAREAYAIVEQIGSPSDVADAAQSVADSLAHLTATDASTREAVSWYRRALQAVPAELMPHHHAAIADNLANTLRQLPEPTEEDLSEACALHRRAGELFRRSGDRGEMARALFNLAAAIGSRPEADLDEVVALYETSMADRPVETVPLEWAQSAIALAQTLVRRGRDDDRDRAAGLLRQTVKLDALEGAPHDAARAWGLAGALHADAGEWDQAARALRRALTAAESRYVVATLATSRESELTDIGGLPHHTAYALARAGHTREAVTVLENSRAREIGRLFDRDHADLSTLDTTSPDAAAAYRAAVAAVARLESDQRTSAPTDTDDVSRIQAALTDAYARLAAVLDMIRQIPEHTVFGRAPEAAMQRATQAGVPLAYLVTTGYGSVALLVGAGPDGEVEAVHGPLTEEDLSDSLQAAGTQFSSQLLDQLGTGLLGNVAQRLLDLRQHRIVLIPTGLLTILPLHAARYQRVNRTTYLLDDVTVSYALSARLLLAAQNKAAHGSTPRLVAVSDPVSTGLGRLAWAEPESQVLLRLFAGATALLSGAAATRTALEEALPGATHLHFACHGSYDSDDPLRSGLHLAGDDRLTLRDLLNIRRLEGIELVVASACQTALSDVLRTQDEAMGLPAGLAYGGARTVVGTLWETGDMSAALLVSRFYTNHLRDRMTPADALAAAQRWLRNATQVELADFARSVGLPEPTRRLGHPMHWAPFIAIGAANERS
ncbi:CHAT domain-containing protein [Actinoplanes sp. CA-015351]|uniref:CHAT domain-containing tetratricopeptide repeat protein n=1 Tax=Actinoplanes sp. CA-015351 TaxID=3239897 RepID=UPI003D982193